MKQSVSRLFGLITILLLLLVVVSASAAEPAKGYVVLPDTASPDGAFSCAWGYKQAGVDFEKLNKADEEYFGTISEENAVENYLVDNTGKKIVCTLGNCDYFSVGAINKNHGSLVFAWSDDSRHLIYGVNSRWQTDALGFYNIAGSGSVEVFELLPAIEKAVRGYLQKKHAAAYKENSESLVISCYEPQISNDGKLKLQISVEVPKQESFGFSLEFSSQISNSRKLGVELLAVEIKESKL